MKDPMFFNKIAAAMLVSLLLFFGLPQLATALRGGHHGGGHEAEGGNPFPQYPVAYTSESAAGAEAAAPVDFATLLAAADPKAGERRAALCKSCHTFDKGGANGTGPNLWGVVGRTVAGHAGFNYTGALKAAGGEWTFDRLSAFLENSQSYIPGTAMVQRFPKAEQRAEIIAYMNTMSDSPLPLPTPAAAPVAEEPAPAAAEGEAAIPAPADGASATTTGETAVPADGAAEAPAEDHSGH
ncbi:MAG: hypothetical protein A3E78_12395 [Alphaproteobacteria bacterium RIFCSPHIGHO2_12_FULL_63_12]|nr:MAG: hypothetical protein A3E78_12395 [Alphaproteobacteria bacterium RIFCSPHIGHO2_12_FULL_63_12]